MNQPGAPKGISAVKKYERKREIRGGATIEHKRLLSLGGEVLEGRGISREVISVLGRWCNKNHLTDFEAEAGRRYAYIMARFDKYFVEGRRTSRSASYERAFGADQELERRAFDGSLPGYEKSARRARRQYDKLQKLLLHYADPVTGRNLMKNALDQMCCEDIEPPSEYRSDMAAALRHIGHEFGVEVKSRRGRPRKGRR